LIPKHPNQDHTHDKYMVDPGENEAGSHETERPTNAGWKSRNQSTEISTSDIPQVFRFQVNIRIPSNREPSVLSKS